MFNAKIAIIPGVSKMIVNDIKKCGFRWGSALLLSVEGLFISLPQICDALEIYWRVPNMNTLSFI